MSQIVSVILAGGQSSRMGTDKAEIVLNGQRLIDRVVDKVGAQSKTIFIAAAHDYGTGFDFIPDIEDSPKGPVAGIYTAWKHLKTQTDGFFTVPVDGPNLPPDLIERLYSKENSSFAIAPERTHPSFAWWRMVDLERVFENHAPDRSLSLHKLADLTGAKPIKWASEAPFMNLNNARDVERFLNS